MKCKQCTRHEHERNHKRKHCTENISAPHVRFWLRYCRKISDLRPPGGGQQTQFRRAPSACVNGAGYAIEIENGLRAMFAGQGLNACPHAAHASRMCFMVLRPAHLVLPNRRPPTTKSPPTAPERLLQSKLQMYNCVVFRVL